MRLAVFIPILLGIGTVLQGTLNRRVAMHVTLPGAAMLNAVVMGCAAALVFGLALSHAGSARMGEGSFSWWFLVPGVLGLAIVIGVPWAMSELGALATFALIIASQLAASAVWDALVEKKPFDLFRLAGAVLTLAGALLASWKR